MSVLSKFTKNRWLAGFVLLLSMAGLASKAQTTTPNVQVEVLGVGAEFLLGGDLTDPENDGLDEAGAANDPSWNWKNITSSHEPDFEGAESAFNIFDGKVGGGADKWCCDDPVPDVPVWVAVEFNQPVSLTHFTVACGNDTPGRDPTDWAIQGSSNGTDWTDIYRFFDTVTPWGDERNLVVKFTLPVASQAYSFIRYICYDTPATLHQLNEIEYFGGVGQPEPPIKKGLVASWNFDGDNLEDSVGVFDATAVGSEPIPFVASKSGYGKAIKLNGEDQYAEVTGGEPDDLAYAGGSISVAGWFKVDAFDTDWQALVAKGEGSNWRVARRAAEDGIAYAGGLGDTATGKSVNDAAWHHFVAVSDSTGAEFGTALYIDGIRDTTVAGSAVLAVNGLRAQIGGNPGAAGREFEGELDDIAIWDRVLTDAEILDLSKNPLSVLLNAIPGDADKDGMPDDYEIAKGFNPNDPSDAALDFDGDGVSNVDEYRAGTDPTDVTKPTIVAAAATPTFNGIDLTFSEDLDPATVIAGNFTITPALAVTAVSYSKKIVSLTTAAQAPGATAYTVAVVGVKDLSKNEVAAGTQAKVYSYLLTKSGVMRLAYWTDIPGTPVNALWDDPRYPDSPTGVGAVYSFDSRGYFPTDALENYGAIIEGIVTPTESGDYRFFIRSDDASQLEVSSDATPANLQWVAEQLGCCNAFTEPETDLTSQPIALVAGRSYFVRMTYKEGGGGDYGQVAWRKEGDTTPAASLLPISGQFVSSAVDLPAPPDGVWTTRTPATAARNIAPDVTVRIVHIDGKSAWTAENVSMKFDGVAVTPTFVKSGTQATITYKPSGLLASLSTHTVSLTYPDPSGAATTLEWAFEVTTYGGPILDEVAGRPGLVFGNATQTADQGGRTGAAGDFGMDFVGAGSINVLDASFINPAAATDKLSVSLWQKVNVRAGSAFWFNSPSSNNATRGFQAHVPWSDSTIYFDSAGCCVVDTQRISMNISSHAGYTGDPTWWNSWHHFAFVKNGAEKLIYIDGTLFHNGGGDPLPTDFTNLIIGGGSGIADNRMQGIMDDFAVYGSALTQAQVTALAGGTAPGAVTGNPGLLAHWDFNDAQAVDVKVMVSRSGGNVTVTSDPAALPAGWVLQTAPSATGPWATQAGSTTPLTVPIGANNTFLRAAKP